MYDETKTIKHNEEIQKKYQKIEQTLPQYSDAQSLLEGVLAQMGEEFTIPYIWLTFAATEESEGLIEVLEKSSLLKDRIKILSESSLAELFQNSRTSLLVNEDLRPYYRLLPINVKYFIRSLAIAPLTINNRLMGSLNCGDASSLRYQPGMDTSLLDQLAGRISDCLAAMTASGKAVSSASEDAQETHKG
jgi:uncharacterized protein YigA (DUF484 family)